MHARHLKQGVEYAGTFAIPEPHFRQYFRRPSDCGGARFSRLFHGDDHRTDDGSRLEIERRVVVAHGTLSGCSCDLVAVAGIGRLGGNHGGAGLSGHPASLGAAGVVGLRSVGRSARAGRPSVLRRRVESPMARNHRPCRRSCAHFSIGALLAGDSLGHGSQYQTHHDVRPRHGEIQLGRSDPDVPRPSVLQRADLAEIVELIRDDDPVEELDAFVAELSLHPHSQRSAVCQR